MLTKVTGALLLLVSLASGVKGQPTPDVTALDYSHDGYELQGYYAEPDLVDVPLPTVLIIPDWDGVNLYEQQRATMVAQELGWIGFAADIYGKDLHEVTNRTQRGELANLYRNDPALFANRIQAAIDFVRGLANVDPNKIAIVGYCFGGTGVLQYAMQRINDVTAIVSVHGGLRQVLSQPAEFEVDVPILLLSGGEDDTSSDIMTLEKTMDFVNATWEITRYSDVQHAWTAFGDNRYNEFADTRTWDSMVHWLKEVFGLAEYASLEPAAATVEAIDYVDVDGKNLTGYLALPDSTKYSLPSPAIILIPDWDGNNLYEKKRATLLAEAGYVSFAADIYGSDLQENLPFPVRMEQATLYRGNKDLFVQRMARAVDLLKEHPAVDNDNISMFGYCFGGTGIIYYAFSNRSDVKLVASFHGGLANLPSDVPSQIVPYVLVLSGGDDDDAHGNQTILEAALNSGNAKWEISRWSSVDHGFTSWMSPAYNARADIRSWEQTLTAIGELLKAPQPTESRNLVDVVVDTDVLSTLETVVLAAGLQNDLSGKGNYTLFAPTNAAFGALDSALRDKLLLEQWKTHLIEILLYHSATGKVASSDLSNGIQVTMLNAEDVTVSISGPSVKVNSANIVYTDFFASNGVIHLIDAVLTPSFLETTIVDVAVSLATTLADLVVRADLDGILSDSNGAVTVFAPTNAAFAALPSETVEYLVSSEGKEDLIAILTYHVVPSVISSSAIAEGTSSVVSFGGTALSITKLSGSVTINEASDVLADVLAINGIVHVIDKVLTLPETDIVTSPPTGSPSNVAGKSSAVSYCYTFLASVVVCCMVLVIF